MKRRRKNAKAKPCNACGIRGPGGNLLAAVAEAACVSMVLMVVHSQHRCGTAPYHGLFRYGTVWYQVLARVEMCWFDRRRRRWRRLSRKMLPRLTPPRSTRFG